jgi:hypothetical protein
MRIFSPVLFAVLGLACTEAPESVCEDGAIEADETCQPDSSSDATPMDLNSAIIGSWVFNAILVVFLDDDQSFLTVPTTVYPDRPTDVPYMDGSGVLEVQFAGTLDFSDDGSLYNTRQIWVDGFLEQDVEVGGQWAMIGGGEDAEGRLELDITGEFFVEAEAILLGPNDLFLEWDREAESFQDDSCVFTIDLSRTD